METIISWSTLFANISFVIAATIALIEYRKNRNRERIEKEDSTFNELDEKYIQYQQLCLDNIDLDIFEIPDTVSKILDPIQKKKELVIFMILFSIFERAFLMYKGLSNELRIKQWNGWDKYIDSFVTRQNFIEAWNIGKDNEETEPVNTYDEEFQEYLNKKIIARKQ